MYPRISYRKPTGNIPDWQKMTQSEFLRNLYTERTTMANDFFDKCEKQMVALVGLSSVWDDIQRLETVEIPEINHKNIELYLLVFISSLISFFGLPGFITRSDNTGASVDPSVGDFGFDWLNAGLALGKPGDLFGELLPGFEGLCIVGDGFLATGLGLGIGIWLCLPNIGLSLAVAGIGKGFELLCLRSHCG
jgi:hypothetical protein